MTGKDIFHMNAAKAPAFFVSVCPFVLTIRVVVLSLTATGVLVGVLFQLGVSMIAARNCKQTLNAAPAASVSSTGDQLIIPFLCGLVRLLAFAPPGLVRGPNTYSV